MLKRAQLCIIFSILILFSVGCMPRIYTETGRRFDMKYFDTVQPGKTTKSELTTALGNPDQTGVKESGKEMWTYLFLSLDYPSRCFLTTTPPQIKHEFMRMTITFDGDKVFEKSYEMSVKEEKKEPAK